MYAWQHYNTYYCAFVNVVKFVENLIFWNLPMFYLSTCLPLKSISGGRIGPAFLYNKSYQFIITVLCLDDRSLIQCTMAFPLTLHYTWLNNGMLFFMSVPTVNHWFKIHCFYFLDFANMYLCVRMYVRM